ncbi:unnamed protein product, partial [marine sediment metagenome]
AAISSGLAIMACHKDLYRPSNKLQRSPINLNFAKYKQEGELSKIIK